MTHKNYILLQPHNDLGINTVLFNCIVSEDIIHGAARIDGESLFWTQVPFGKCAEVFIMKDMGNFKMDRTARGGGYKIEEGSIIENCEQQSHSGRDYVRGMCRITRIDGSMENKYVKIPLKHVTKAPKMAKYLSDKILISNKNVTHIPVGSIMTKCTNNPHDEGYIVGLITLNGVESAWNISEENLADYDQRFVNPKENPLVRILVTLAKMELEIEKMRIDLDSIDDFYSDYYGR